MSKRKLTELLTTAMFKRLTLSLIILGISFAGTSQAQEYLQRSEFIALVDDLEKNHGFDRMKLINLFSEVKQQKSILEAISRPAEKALTWKQYRPIFLKEKRIKGGIKFWQQHKQTLLKAEKIYGVPPEIIVAIIGVETRYGNNKGNYRVIDALSTLGFDYPPRSAFFYKELKEFLLLEKYAGIDPATTKGSYAGAMGFGQFISSSYRHYAVDFNNDGKIDLVNDPVDAIGSVANYFKMHGWKTGALIAGRGIILIDDKANKEQMLSGLKPLIDTGELKPKVRVKDFAKYGLISTDNFSDRDKATVITLQGIQGEEHWVCLDNFYVITRYNHSNLYAMAVFQLSQKIKMAMDYEVAYR